MTELWLFIIVGALAVAAAVMMLLSSNAVYSALFLILVMGCIAFLFLLLDAPFLAMIQITVYAGAIMVLFMFVIMLLGAERLGGEAAHFGWFTPLAVIVVAVFLLVAGVAVTSGGVDDQQPDAGAPLLRVVNAATDAGTVDVHADDMLLASAVPFDGASEFMRLEPAEYTITFTPEAGEPFGQTFTFAPDSVQTLVAYGTEGDRTLVVVPSDLSTPANRHARVTFFNAYPLAEQVALVDLGVNGELDRDATQGGAITDTILVPDLAPGDVSSSFEFEEGRASWAFVRPANGEILSRVTSGARGRDFALERETTKLVVLTAERSLIDNSVRPAARVFEDEAEPAFGGPAAIGEELFTRYLLPFEMLSLLLLAAMVGAIVLTHKEEARVRDRTLLRRRVSRPLASVIAQQVGHDVTQPETPEPPPALPPAAQGPSPAGD